MPTLNGQITDFVPGDDFGLRRKIDRDGGGVADETLASGVTVSKAWLTVKAKLSDADVDALVQKEITTTNVPGTGEIEDNGTGDTDPVLRFDLDPDDTEAIGVSPRHYDVQVLTSGSKLYTAEKGRIYGGADQVTKSRS